MTQNEIYIIQNTPKKQYYTNIYIYIYLFSLNFTAKKVFPIRQVKIMFTLFFHLTLPNQFHLKTHHNFNCWIFQFKTIFFCLVAVKVCLIFLVKNSLCSCLSFSENCSTEYKNISLFVTWKIIILSDCL